MKKFALIIVFVSMFLPSFAFGLDKVTIQAQYDESMDQENRIAFVEEKYEEYTNENLDGFVVSTEKDVWFVLEGDEESVQNNKNELDSDNRLSSVLVVNESTYDKDKYDSFVVHTEIDPNTYVETGSLENPGQLVVKVEFSPEVDPEVVFDGYYDSFVDKGYRGLVFIPNYCGSCIPNYCGSCMRKRGMLVLEGNQSDLESTYQSIQNDSVFVDVSQAFGCNGGLMWSLKKHYVDDSHLSE